jgi:phosphinothricin acetyltransferase
LHEKLGFQKVGSFPGIGYKDGRWLDVGWWQLALQPEISGPPEPQPFPSICNGPAVVAALDGGRTLANHSI